MRTLQIHDMIADVFVPLDEHNWDICVVDGVAKIVHNPGRDPVVLYEEAITDVFSVSKLLDAYMVILEARHESEKANKTSS